MFPYLPEEMKRKIWKFYWSGNILKQIRSREPIWINPSSRLLNNTTDIGAYQHGHSDLERTLFYRQTNCENMRSVVNDCCFRNICYNCLYDGFPCMNATYYGLFKPTMVNLWNMSYYRNTTYDIQVLADLDLDAEII